MRQLVINWLINVTGKDSSQFLYAPDELVFEMFFSIFHEKYYNYMKEIVTKEQMMHEFAEALGKDIKENRYF